MRCALRHKSSPGVGLIAVILGCLVFAGCGGGVEIDTTPENPAFSNLGGIAELYYMYRSRNRGKTPNLEQIKQYSTENSYTLNRLEVDNVDELLVSKRDNQPLVLMLEGSKLTHNGAKIIAHETTGANGSRMVALDNGGALLLNEEEFNAAKK